MGQINKKRSYVIVEASLLNSERVNVWGGDLELLATTLAKANGNVFLTVSLKNGSGVLTGDERETFWKIYSQQ